MRGGTHWRRLGGIRADVCLLAAIAGISVLVASNACVPDRPSACRTSHDCDSGICNLHGFCEAECAADRDCPCGSKCATTCGLCIRDDWSGPATCFAFDRGMSTDAVLGSCRTDQPPATDAGAAVVVDGGVCQAPPPTLPSCLASPPITDAATVNDARVDADAAVDGAPTDATADGGVTDAPVEATGD